MSAESPRHARSGGPLLVPSQPPSDRTLIDTVSGFINDVTLSSTSNIDPKDVIQWARFETADINEPIPEGDTDNDISPLLLILGYGSGVQVWLVPPTGEAQEVLSWRQGTVRVLRVLPTPQHNDCFAAKRPLIALCDSASPGPSFCSLSFISIRGGEQVKSIKFKNQILDVLANKRSIVVAFSERFAVFDASTLEDRMAVTTCYPCPDPLGGSAPINPLTLGDRWLAYADKKLNPSKRSSGGCEGEGVTSYTATVLHAAKSLSKGLRGLGESVAHSLAGGRGTSQSPSPPNADIQQPGIVTVIDIEGFDEEDGQETEENYDPIVAHFIAHSEAIIALKLDASGMLLVTADRRGHDFHVFRINPHPCGPSLASVHHLYVLHRGDTTAKVQDIAISPDSRWCAVSTLRGTTHVFPISAYGGACGVRTHTQPRVVNRLSRFHRSAGLPIHACAPNRSGSPVGDGLAQGAWFPNPRLPPYPLPTTVTPLAQLRPTANLPTHTITRTSSGRQRLSSTSEDSSSAPLLARARLCCASVPVNGNTPRAPAALSLYLLSASGSLMHLVLHPKPAHNVPKEKICDESPIELEVEPIAQWPLQRPPVASDLLAPLPPSNPLLHHITRRRCADVYMSEEERWLSQVEIVTHAGPHRRLWMGPQFVFKTYNHSGSSSSLSEAETVEVETGRNSVARSNPVNMPCVRPLVPVLIDSGSASSLEHSPSDSFRRKSLLSESGRAPSVCDVQLREDLAEAMKEDHGWRKEERREVPRGGIARVVDPLGTVVAGVGRERGERDGGYRSPADDADLYLHSNADEATFRPVVRAASALPVQPDMIVRPLPRDTTIPVQTLPVHTLSSTDEPIALKTEIVIPVALTGNSWNAPDKVTKATETKKPRADSAKNDEDKPASIIAKKIDRKILDVKDDCVNKDLKQESDECKRETCDRGSTEMVERESNVKSLPKLIQPSDDIQPPVVRPRIKKSPTSKSVSDSISVSLKNKTKESETRESETNFEICNSKDDVKVLKETEQTKNTSEKENKTIYVGTTQPFDQTENPEVKVSKRSEDKLNKEAEKINVKDKKSKKQVIVETDQNMEEKVNEQTVPDDITITAISESEYKTIEAINEFTEISLTKDNNKGSKRRDNNSELKMKSCEPDTTREQSLVEVTLKWPTKKEKNRRQYDEIKTEEQAWDMLLNEPASVNDKVTTVNVKEDAKLKIKRNRKKTHEDSLTGTDDDSFIEIHQIEEKQSSCGELVSISTVEDQPCSFYSAKTKKARSPKHSLKCDDIAKPECNWSNSNLNKPKKIDVSEPNLFVVSNFETKPKIHPDGTSSETTSYISSVPKSKKSKSLSPYPENRKQNEKDVYVIDSGKEEFPDIKITKGNRPHKKYEKQLESKTDYEAMTVIDKPPISWSSVAASKSVKKNDDKKFDSIETTSRNTESKETLLSSSAFSEVSLQDKLFELCKRTDIMVAECDTPSELKFVEEHHAVLTDLPPLEPLDFALDDFKLEVMKDSLLDVNDTKITSPICKINIDDILSSIKETTNKVIESSMFNLVDLEKVPAKTEKGFKMVENDKITTQEIKVDDEVKSDADGMEKSSDEDLTSPITSTDSDKEEKKNNGATNLVLPSKQSAKSKKSRRKRK